MATTRLTPVERKATMTLFRRALRKESPGLAEKDVAVALQAEASRNPAQNGRTTRSFAPAA